MRSILVIALLFLGGGCASVRAAGEQCENLSSNEIADVFEVYETYRDGGLEPGLLNTARRSLEGARYALFGEGKVVVDSPCPPARRAKASWKELRDDFEAAEILVRELEDIRGVRFVDVRGEAVVWTDATTGQEIPAEMAASL